MESLVYIFCSTLPSHILPFTLFWHFPWRSRRAAIALSGVNVLCKMAAASYCLANGVYFRPLELLFGLAGFLIYKFYLRMDFFKQLFAYLLIVDYLLVVRGIASFIAVRLFSASSQGWISSLGCILLYSLSLPLLICSFRPSISRVYRTHAPRIWRTIWLIPALLTFLTLLLTNAYQNSSAESSFFLLCRIILLLCTIVICRMLYEMLDYLQKQIAFERQVVLEKRMMEMMMEEQKKHSLLIMENAEQTRRMRHDLRHQLTAIQAMAGTDHPKLRQYVDGLIHDIPSAVKTYCENPAVNAIVSHYAEACQREGISFAAHLTVPACSPQLTDSSLCVIFGNLLENALEACQRMDGRERFIRLDSAVEHGVLTVTMDNSFDGRIRMEDGKFFSSKRDACGIGLSSIQAVARAHQGDARFEAHGAVFQSSVYATM